MLRESSKTIIRSNSGCHLICLEKAWHFVAFFVAFFCQRGAAFTRDLSVTRETGGYMLTLQ